MIFAYLDGRAVPDHLYEWSEDRDVRWRNGRKFANIEPHAEVVYTDLDGVRDAYEEEGVEVKPLPSDTKRYVVEESGRGWHKVKDTKTGEYVDGASSRDADEAQETADELNG